MIELFGIRFRFHPLFLLIVVISVITGYFIEIITLFGIVLIHELGHIAAAKGFGWKISEIQFLPFGGVAVMDDHGSVSAWEELLVALAGPLQNGLMIIVAGLMKQWGWWESDWGSYFMKANLMIACFNLLPVLPLDGGKVMRAVMSLWINYHRTLVWCTWISLIMSILVIMISLQQWNAVGIQVNLLMIGLFLFTVNWHELKNIPYIFLRFLIHRESRVAHLIKRGALAHPIVVNQTKSLGDILQLLMRDKVHLIYIMNDAGTVHAVVPEQQLIRTYFHEKKPGNAVIDFFM